LRVGEALKRQNGNAIVILIPQWREKNL
jgi:hypothetical protein